MKYAKAIIAVLGAVATWGYTAAPGGISLQESFGLLGAIATALGVALVPNIDRPTAPAPEVGADLPTTDLTGV